MNENKTAGIDEVKLDRLKLEINDYAERINNTFQCISDLVEKTDQYFVCESGVLFRNHFLSLKDNFKVVSQNILSYTDDLSKVQANYKKSTHESAEQISKKAEEIL